jgi:hypothetical protein
MSCQRSPHRDVASGWYTDPSRRHRLRYWDGRRWTAWAAEGDQAIVDAGLTRPTRTLLMLSGFGAVFAMPFVAWWLIGDQSETNLRPRDELDYVSRAPAISGRVTAIVGAIALVIVVVGVVVHFIAAKRGLLDLRWLAVLATFLIAGFLLAAIGRAVTAGVVGANIGGGMAIVFGLPVVALLIGYAVVQATWLIASKHRPKSAQ